MNKVLVIGLFCLSFIQGIGIVAAGHGTLDRKLVLCQNGGIIEPYDYDKNKVSQADVYKWLEGTVPPVVLSTITSLHATSYSLEVLPQWVNDCIHLAYLSLQSNKFTAFPRLPKAGKSVKWIDMTENKITQVTREDFQNYPNLMSLRLGGNPLTKVELPPTLSERLDLSADLLPELPDFSPLKKGLRFLELSLRPDMFHQLVNDAQSPLGEWDKTHFTFSAPDFYTLDLLALIGAVQNNKIGAERVLLQTPSQRAFIDMKILAGSFSKKTFDSYRYMRNENSYPRDKARIELASHSPGELSIIQSAPTALQRLSAMTRTYEKEDSASLINARLSLLTQGIDPLLKDKGNFGFRLEGPTLEEKRTIIAALASTARDVHQGRYTRDEAQAQFAKGRTQATGPLASAIMKHINLSETVFQNALFIFQKQPVKWTPGTEAYFNDLYEPSLNSGKKVTFGEFVKATGDYLDETGLLLGKPQREEYPRALMISSSSGRVQTKMLGPTSGRVGYGYDDD